MQDVIVVAEARNGAGKSVTRKLRAVGRVPAVIYGHGIETPVNVTVDPKEMGKALRTPWGQNVLLTVQIDGKPHKAMCREVQRNPVTRAIRHVDFVSPNPKKDVTVWVPLNITGKSIGISTGGKLRQPYREIRVKTTPEKIPADVTVDITNLDQNMGIMASDLNLGEGVKVVYDRDFVVAKILAPKGTDAEKK